MTTEVSERTKAEWLRVKEDLRSMLGGPPTWIRVWERLLNEEQRRALGGDVDELYFSRRLIDVWKNVHDLSEDAAILDLSLRLNYLSQCDYDYWSRVVLTDGEMYSPKVKDAVAGRGLVLIDQPERIAYLKGALIPVRWEAHAAWWEFLWKLATASEMNSWLDEKQFDSATTWQAVKDRKSNLINADPSLASLEDIIKVRAKPHGYRLDLERGQIHRFDMVNGKLELVGRHR